MIGHSLRQRDDRRGAVFGPERDHRYRLWRTWDRDKPTVLFVMLNPSTADETELDPTCRRCQGYAKRWEYGRLLVGNIFSLRATNPDKLYTHPAPVGPDNRDHLVDMAEEADLVVCAWGQHGQYMDQGRDVWRLLHRRGIKTVALDRTQDGHPAHPLYQPADRRPEWFEYPEVAE